MSNEEFENYLALVSRLLRLNRSQREMIRNEMRDHLETRVEEMVDSGVDRKDAIRSALEEFGDAAGLANQFQLISNLNQRRWMMRFATLSIIGAFVAAVFMMSMWPGDARFGAPANSIAQQEDPFASTTSETKTAVVETGPIRKTSISESSFQIAQSTSELESKINHCLKTECDFAYEATPFVDVMSMLRERYKINIMLSDSARDDSLTSDTPVTFASKKLPLGTSLKLLLEQYNATFVVKDGVLKFISLDVAHDPEFFTRAIIDCRPLLDFMKRDKANRQANSIVVDPKNETKTPRYVAEAELSDIVKMTVNAESWDDTNGDGTLAFVGGCMLISQDHQTVNEILSLVENLTKTLSPAK